MTGGKTMPTRKSNRSDAGFTLVELLIALAIGAIVLATVFSLFLYQQRSYLQQSEMARNQAQLRSALQLMSRDVRMAGYSGIPLGFDREPNLYPIAPWPMTGSVTMLEDGTQPRIDSQYGKSEAIEVWGNFTRQTATLAADYSPGANTITVNDPKRIIFTNNVKRILIGNSMRVSYHEITGALDGSTPGAPCTLTIYPPLGVPMSNGDVVAPIIRLIYFVADAPETTGALTEQVGTLFRRTYQVDPSLALAARYASGNTCFQDDALADNIDYLDVHYSLNSLNLANEPIKKTDDSADTAGSETNGPGNPCQINAIDLRLVSKTFPALTPQGQPGTIPLILDQSQNVKPRNLGLSRWTCTVSPVFTAWQEQKCSGT